MNSDVRNRVRFLVVIAAFLSAIMLVICLPTLIWSRPFAINGYYVVHLDDGLLCYYRDGKTLTFLHEQGLAAPYSHEITEEFSMNLVAVKTWKNLMVRSDKETGFTITYDSKPYVFEKTSNPITIWRIIWLELSQEY